MDPAYLALRTGIGALGLPPLGLARLCGRGLGSLARALDSRHRGIVTENLAASFPEKDAAWVEETARACFQHLGMVIAEIPTLATRDVKHIARRTRVHGLDRLKEALARKKGVIMLTGHLGNWEWANLGVTALHPEFSACVVARPLDWPPAERLVNGWRTRLGASVVPKSRSLRALLRHLKKNGIVALLLDQNVDWYDGEWVDFFGRPACTNKGMALLAMHTGSPVLPFYNFRAPDGVFDIHFGEELVPRKTGDKTQDVWDNTQMYASTWEEIIRQNPSQWFWMHQRWKTKPYHPWPREN